MRLRALLSLFIIPFLLFCSFPITALGADEKEDGWKDEMIYFIMVDRFFNGNYENDYEVDREDPKAYHGGDLEGIIQKLDYIKDLGYTAIWITPIMDNGPKGYHGYWVKDFMKVEEHFGTMEDAKRLVEEAHKRDMKVLFDFVVNHTGYNHPWLEDPEKKDWFHEEKRMMGESPSVLENAWLAGLPDLNTENEEVKQYLFDAAEYWIKETGVDGFRLDTVKHVPKEFWADFNDHVKSVDPDFFLLGEVWYDNTKKIASYEETGIDSFVDYPLYEVINQSFQEAGNDLSRLYDVWEANKTFFEQPAMLASFIDNHDNVRFTRKALKNKQNPVTRWKLALAYQFTAPEIPITYYGTEVPLDGGKDPDNRRLMNFKSGDDTLEKWIQQLTALRKEFPALTKGDYKELYSKDGLAAYSRSYEGETVVIVINNDTETRVFEVSGLEENKQLRGVLTDDLVREVDTGTYKIAMNREQAEIYVMEEDTGFNWLLISLIGGVFAAFVVGIIYLSRKSKRIEAQENV
ncbi:alpha-amylase family glycosyl hydrolase [Thalassobacillus pellis]|uniref:alpha-amylase family glycosyl hydrolase n=1 Tax=Thalassobacillus pellis TaxID=748008 RepID=UPI00195FB476|nr:alpha-amylase family glycosyl hydrolase [Thalassobacillus pellis]MBM7554077.1 alpha-amylase [Thalassobacillus pellis]